MAGYREIAQLIAARVRRPNPIVGGQIVADGGLANDTPVVTVSVGGATRRAVYLAPHAVQEGGHVFVTRLGPDAGAPLAVIATNYQVTSDGVWGTGTRPWGAGGGVWGV